MSLRTLVEDAAYEGLGLMGRAASAWRSASPGARAAVLAVVLGALVLWWLGPRLGLYGRAPGGFTDEELKLIERGGSGEGSGDELPWWYPQDE